MSEYFVFVIGVFLLLFAGNAFGQSANWINAGRFGGSYPESGTNILAGPGGTFYLVGRFQTNTNFAGHTLTAQSGNETYVLKMDSSGNVFWYIDIYGQALYEEITGMDVDQYGNLYLAGNFENYLEIDSVALNNSTGGLYGSYLAKIDSNGGLDWVREVVLSKDQRVVGMEVDEGGRILVGGQFADTARIDSDTLFAAGGSDFYTVAFDSSGAMIWATGFGSPDFDVAWGFGANDGGEIAFSGILRDTANIDGNTYGLPAADQFVITRQDRNGNFRFVITESGINSGHEIFELEISEQNDIYAGGDFSDSISIAGQTFLSGGGKDIILTKYNPVGVNAWVKNAFSNGSDELSSLAVDHLGDVYFTGYYTNKLKLDLDSVSTGSIIGDFFLAKANASGGMEWIQNANAGFFDYVNGVDIDIYDGIIYITGEFTSTITFGGAFTLTSAGASDVFWGQLCQGARVDLKPGQGGNYCIGTSSQVEYLSFGCYNAGNNFRIELSDSGGSFSSPVIIGSQNGISSGTIPVTYPYFLTGGDHYRYRVVSNNPTHISAPNSTDISIYTGSEANITSGGDSVLCFGETATLNAGAGFLTYSWSTGASTQSISVSNGGNFSVAVIGNSGCLSRDTFQVIGPLAPPPTPSIQPGDSVALCSGGDLVLDAGSGYFKYLWNTGSTTQYLTVSQAGIYFLTVENGFGCQGFSDTVTIYKNPRPVLTASNDTLRCSAQAFTYQWFRNGATISGATQQFYVPVLNGNFHVRILDANNCIEVSDTLSFAVGLDQEWDSNDLLVYPDPADQFLRIACTNPLVKPDEITLSDLTGRVIYRQVWSDGQSNELSLSTIANGQYLLRISGEGTHFVRKVTIIH